jgi:hypothetical protein
MPTDGEGERSQVKVMLRVTPLTLDDAVQEKMTGLDHLAQEIIQAAPQCFGEKT